MAGAIYPDLEGSVVLVTGGGSGIGAGIVRQFCRQKARVGFVDIAQAPSRALAAEMAASGATACFEPCDLTDVAALQGAVARLRAALGPIRVLVNNAANDDRHATETVTSAYWDDRMAVNLKHQFFAAQAVLPDMQAAGGGAIVNLGSVSWMLGMGGMPVYTAAKSAVLGLTRALARDYGPYNVRVNAVAPGWIRTQLTQPAQDDPGRSDPIVARTPMRRWGEPTDVAGPILFLLSEPARFVTGVLLPVDGGYSVS